MSFDFKITPQAAQQVIQSAHAHEVGTMPLRIAAKKADDGSFEYGIGFDDFGPEDIKIDSEGVSLIIAAPHQSLLNHALMDYVELAPGEFAFIFLNPNDPNYVPPQAL